MPAKKTIIKKKKTKQKQKQKQKQVQNVIVNVNQSKPSRRRSNYTPKDKPQPRPQSQSVNVMPAHHTFYVDTGRPQYNTLRAPEPAVSESLRAPEPAVSESLRAPEEVEAEKPKRGRPIGSKNRPVPTAEAVPVTPRFNPFQLELMKATENRRREREELGLENSSDEVTHQGLNVSSSSSMNQPFAEDNLESLVSNEAINSPVSAVSGGRKEISGENDLPESLKYEDIQIYNDYMSMKADELKQICKDKGIPSYGSKRDMTFRLMGISEPKRQYNKKS